METDARLAPPSAVLLLLLFLIGCHPLPEVPVRPPSGFLVAIQRGPLTTSFNETPTNGRLGTAKTFFLREPFLRTTWAFGDASIAAAMAEGRLRSVHYADFEMVSILGAAGVFETRVYGEPSLLRSGTPPTDPGPH